jgi:putative N6-adenine-specific DNA methylase
MSIKMVATCLFGLEKLLGEELDALGVKRLETIDGRIVFEGEEADIPRLNIGLRCAERVFILMGDFAAPTFDALFEGTKALPWEEWIGKNDAFPVSGHSIKSALTSIPACQKIVNKALADRLGAAYGLKWLPQDSGVTYAVEFFLLKDRAMLLIDTSGAALHKRGYRPHANAAPLRETLAAAMVLSARPREDVLIWDPFCGSGTIVIEAAMMMKNIAPGLDRHFAAESFKFIPESDWKNARIEARQKIIHNSEFEAWGSDIDEEVLSYARANASRAGVDDVVKFFKADARRIEKPDRRGTLVCNPPYGERLMTEREVERLYADMGKTFAKFDPWQMYILTSCESFQRHFGRRADKIRKLYNGMIPCNLYQYFKPKNK